MRPDLELNWLPPRAWPDAQPNANYTSWAICNVRSSHPSELSSGPSPKRVVNKHTPQIQGVQTEKKVLWKTQI